jgi:hypothetical protein
MSVRTLDRLLARQPSGAWSTPTRNRRASAWVLPDDYLGARAAPFRAATARQCLKNATILSRASERAVIFNRAF